MLGKASDERIAMHLGCGRDIVQAERRSRGIAPFRKRGAEILWTRRAVALLGADSDRAVAAELGVSHAVVCRKRLLLGIPPCNPKRHHPLAHDWTSEEEALLGTAPDARVACELGMSRMSVYTRRSALGIPAFGPRPRVIRWSRRWLAQLGKRSDDEIANAMGVHPSSVTKKRRLLRIPAIGGAGVVEVTPALRRLLRLPNVVVVQRTGLKNDTIVRLRRELGIRAPLFIDVPWTKQALRRLGKVPDARLAEEIGVCVSAVRGRRLRAGIGPSRPTRRFEARERSLLVSGLPASEIARRLRRPLPAVRAAIHYWNKVRKGRGGSAP